MSEEEPNELLPQGQSSVPAVIPLGPGTSVDLSFLSEAERRELTMEFARGQIDINKKAGELAVEAKALEATLAIMVNTTNDVAAKESSVTITHTQTSSVGRTEVLMGNTPQAQKGKLTKSQTGQADWTPYYVGGGLIAIFLIAMAVILR